MLYFAYEVARCQKRSFSNHARTPKTLLRSPNFNSFCISTPCCFSIFFLTAGYNYTFIDSASPYRPLPPPVLLRAALPGLLAIRPPSLRGALHARVELDVDPRRGVESKRLGHLIQVELGDVEHGPQAVAGVGVDVALEAVLGRLVEVVVLHHQLLQLALDVDDLVGRELELGDGHAGLLEVAQEGGFRRLQEHQTPSLGVGTSRSAHAVNVVTRITVKVKSQ